MKAAFILSLDTLFILMGLPLLFLADIAYSLAGSNWELKAVAAVLVVLSSIPFYLIVRRWIERDGANDLRLFAFSLCWGALFFLLVSFTQNVRQSQGISSYWNQFGNCNTLFSSVSDSELSKSWIENRKPVFHYAYAVAEDFCRLNRLYQDFSSEEPSVCTSTGFSDRAKCYRRVIEEIMIKAPLTLPGIDMALLEGLALSLRERSGTDHLAKVRENFRVAAETFGLIQTSLQSIQRHATPETVVGFSSQFKSKEEPTPSLADPEWDLIKLLYRRRYLSANDEVRFLTGLDQRLQARFLKEIFEKIQRINDRLKAEAKTNDSEISNYKLQIDQYNRYFSHFQSEIKGA